MYYDVLYDQYTSVYAVYDLSEKSQDIQDILKI